MSAEGPEPAGSARAALSSSGEYATRILTSGEAFHGANGLLFDSAGRLLVASDLDRSISVVEPSSGRVLERIGPERGVESPDDLAIGPDGALYWTAFFTGEVGRLLPTGEKQTVARLGPGVNAIAFSPEGRLFVTRVFLGDELYELDPSGVAAPRKVAAGLGGLNGMQFGPDGQLYGPLWFRRQVARVDVETGALTPIASVAGTPAMVRFDRLGRMHVVDQMRGELLRVELSSGETTVVGHFPEGGDGLAFDSENRAFIGNAHDGSVVELMPHGTSRTVVRGAMAAPGGVAVVSREGHSSLFIADALSMRELDAVSGRELRLLHSVIGVSAMASPLTVSADGSSLVTSSWFANAVQVIDSASGTVTESHRDFATPLNALRFRGDLVVAEVKTASVVMKRAGTGEKVVLASGLYVPTGLATDGSDLYAADWVTGRIVKVLENGEVLSPPRPVAAGLSRPEGMALDRDGSLLVVETGKGRLVRVQPATGALSVVEEGLELGMPGSPGLPPTYVFNGVAVDGEGAVYVTLDRRQAVLKLSPEQTAVP